MNYRMVFYMVGRLLQMEAALLLLPAGVALIYGDGDLLSLLIAAVVAAIVGTAMTLCRRPKNQTIYAKEEGAVAAPTAGLHFSKHLLKRMEIKGIDTAEITLHVGLGNFRTVDVEDLTKHKMDSEQIFIPAATAEIVNRAKESGHRVCAIGTTVQRTIESSVSTSGMLKPYEGWTNKFIFAPYEFNVADSMVSNFHLPGSTQLMMGAACGGYDNVMNAYKVAIEEGYRFGTYGDAMLIL